MSNLCETTFSKDVRKMSKDKGTQKCLLIDYI